MPGLEKRLQVRENLWPALRDAPLHFGPGLQLIVGDGQAHGVREGLYLEGDARVAAFVRGVRRNAPGQDEAPRRAELHDLAHEGDRTGVVIGSLVPPRRSD